MKTEDALENVARNVQSFLKLAYFSYTTRTEFKSVAKQKLTSCMIQKEMLIT